MHGKLNRLHGAEEDARNKANQLSTLLELLEKLKKELATTQQEKKTIDEWAQKYWDEKLVSELKDQNGLLMKEKDELNRLMQEQTHPMTVIESMWCSRENGSCYSTGDSAARDRFEQGAFSLPESPDRTPSPRGEIRRSEERDGLFHGSHD